MSQDSKKTHLQDTLQMLEYVAAHKAYENKYQEKRQVNIRLPEPAFQLLDQLSDHFDESRTSLAQQLLESAIADACDTLGIQLDIDELRAKAAAL